MNFNKKVSDCGRFLDGYETKFEWNGITYYIMFSIFNNDTYSVMLSSGKKRRELKIFEGKKSKSFNGIEVLIKIINIVNIEFPKFYNSDLTLVVFWADTKRRRVYKRLENYGWRLSRVDGNLCYLKKFLAQDL